MIDPVKYPIHVALGERAAERTTIQNVLEWMKSRGISFCYWSGNDDEGEYVPYEKSGGPLMAEIMGIDYAAFSAEKDAMVEEMMGQVA